ncbi:S9 family peptidase [Actinomycetospora sp. TBRC 11914]|uniref:alpha/beta hydrolase family protein n=1 Tax=Actinomycetospora sp. TBRC 11914 TaxID=2729387 RepID=UPI00145EF9F8|nr:alpha/beta hydrolase [Actinomycetospora sp. TBRC 11914]NMO93198.1 alpha/beta hydrolase [Actinomycetospora sp. TBRC 11914]
MSTATATPAAPPFSTGDDAFDAQLQRSLTAAMRSCADLGEVRSVATRIQPRDFDSWAREWRALADAVVADGDESLGRDDAVSARRCYLRAVEYYRQAFFFERDDLTRAELHADYRAHVAAFRAAMPLLTTPCTPMELERDGVAASGYLLRPAADDTPRPTVIAPAGYDSTAEGGYAEEAVSALEYGMNCLVVEGPGQGGVLYDRGQTLRPDFETVLRPVLDWVVTQPGIDPAALVLFGRSFAGYLAPRGAAGESRIAALVADPAQYDFGAALHARLGDVMWRRVEQRDPTLDADLAGMLADPQQRNDYQCRMATHGVTTLSDYFWALSQFSLEGLAGRITCPTLALEAEGDFAGTGQLDVFAKAVGGPVTTHHFTAAEGAGGHCEGLGQQRLDRVVYGWLATVLPTGR